MIAIAQLLFELAFYDVADQHIMINAVRTYLLLLLLLLVVVVVVVGWLFGFHGISTFEGYLMPNPFLYK